MSFAKDNHMAKSDRNEKSFHMETVNILKYNAIYHSQYKIQLFKVFNARELKCQPDHGLLAFLITYDFILVKTKQKSQQERFVE